MNAAVEQLLVVDVDFFCLLACFLGYSGHGLAFALVVLDNFLDNVGGFRVAVQIVVEVGLHEIAYCLCHGGAIGSHGLGA